MRVRVDAAIEWSVKQRCGAGAANAACAGTPPRRG
jgi:hypothetical protein